ncbi:MAG TPA: polysaccharide deacetylase family protein [Acidimicrobiia bacterium]
MRTQGVKAFALRVVKVSAEATDRVRRPDRGVVVLCYHRVDGGSRRQLDLARDTFDAQMAALAAGPGVVTLDAALALLALPVPPPHDPVVVTFDDGTADFADHAVPVLERHRVPATLYLATAFVEERRPMSHDARPLTWAALKDALSTGLVTVGSHTHTHRLLDRAPVPVVADELDRSVGLIGERLGVDASHFAYPKAVAGSPDAERAVRSRFRSAALAGTRANPYGRTDRYRLARSPIQVADGMRWFDAKTRGGLRLEDDVRRALNRLRYAKATT